MYPVRRRKINKQYKSFNVTRISSDILDELKLIGIELSQDEIRNIIRSFNMFIIQQMKAGKTFSISHLGTFVPTEKHLEKKEKKKIKNDIYKEKTKELKQKINVKRHVIYNIQREERNAFNEINNIRISEGKKPLTLIGFKKINDCHHRIKLQDKELKRMIRQLKKIK
jgi:nucleoid DNA-binding protein